MARPRVFISSTFYDLKYVRSSLEIFVNSLGFEPILFEKGDIAFIPDVALDESCYREAQNADIFVLIVGGRYGSASTSANQKQTHKETYESITRKEFESAQNADVPTFILIEGAVGSEYQTYLRNKDAQNIKYAHVDSTNIFRLIETIYEKRRNNPVFNFSKAEEIEIWLREQWAGLFRELLRQRSQQKQLSALNAQVGELQSINSTLKNYLEEVLNKVSPGASAQIIKTEDDKLKEEKISKELERNHFYNYILSMTDKKELARGIAEMPKDLQTLESYIEEKFKLEDLIRRTKNVLFDSENAQSDYNQARATLGLDPIVFGSESRDRQAVEMRQRREKALENKIGGEN